VTDDGTVASWQAEHDGYQALRRPAVHRRTVSLDRSARSVEITDTVSGGPHDVRVAFHLGPQVAAELTGATATLSWTGGSVPEAARLTLPSALRWELHSAQTSPALGWYSSGLGQRVPAWTLLGVGTSTPGEPLTTLLEFARRDDTTAQAEAR